MSKTSSRILSRKLVFLYYYARLFNEEILSLPPEIEETKKITEQPSHEDLSEIADWLGMSSEELDEQTEEAVIIPTTIVMNDESIQEDIDFIIQHQLSQHTNNQTITYDQDFVSQLTHGYAIYRDIIAELIAPYTDKFGYNEMSLTRRAILLLGYVESKIIDTPANIIINECVELAKSYEDVSAGKLINGIMHQLLDVTIEEIITESHEQHPTNDDTTEHHTTETEDTTQSS